MFVVLLFISSLKAQRISMRGKANFGLQITSNTDENNEEYDKYLADLYYSLDSSPSFSSLNQMYNYIKTDGEYNISKKYLRKWLHKQPVYTTHLQRKEKNSGMHVLSLAPLFLVDIDLMSVQNLEKFNKNCNFLMAAIDVFSKFAAVSILKNKTPSETVRGFKEIHEKFKAQFPNTPIRTVRTDKGGEWGGIFSRYLKNQGIYLHKTESTKKANFCERFNKTFKDRLYRFFDYKQSYVYDKMIIQKIVDNYNSSLHTTIDISPESINKQNYLKVWKNVYLRKQHGRYKQLPRPVFKKGDRVRILLEREKFQRSWYQNYSNEIFKIHKVIKIAPEYVYSIKDDNEVLHGWFTRYELVKDTGKPSTDFYKIEKILGKHKIKNKTYYLVKWSNLPTSANSYVAEDELYDYHDTIHL